MKLAHSSPRIFQKTCQVFPILIFILIATLNRIEIASAENKKIIVTESSTALKNPVSTFSSPIVNLGYEPLVDLQERNTSSAQGDISIRGGIFENTAVRIGSTSLFDPQTGHYTAEIPISPFMLSAPEIYTGLQNSVYGFNANAGTINYSWKEISKSIALRTSVGTHGSNVQHGYEGVTDLLDTGADPINFDIDIARSELHGTRIGGQNNFQRLSSRIQHTTNNSQSDIFFGRQTKYFSWPNLYALQELHTIVGSSGIESEDLATNVVMANHRANYGDKNYAEVSAYYRKNKDDYEFDRYQPSLFNEYQHKSTVWSFGLSGLHDFDLFEIAYSGQHVAEDLDSTALTYSPYLTRGISELAVVPQKSFQLTNSDSITIKTGLGIESSDRNSEAISPVAGAYYDILGQETTNQQQFYFEYAKSSQLPGYTAIASNSESGLFRGNQDLVRERSQNFELGYKRNEGIFRLKTATFYRRDANLVDWTYNSSTTPFAARFANNVDIDVVGLETVIGTHTELLDTALGYTFMHKDEDYGVPNVDGSFYALNFPEHRATGSFILRPLDDINVRIDNELRFQKDNALRSGKDHVVFTSAEVSYFLPFWEQTSLTVAADNIWKNNFQDVPGVPGRGRLLSIGIEIAL